MPSTLVFFGIEETTPICIKFVRRYSSEVHSFCASRGFAPELKGVDKLPGGWYMVVMEDISDAYRQADSPTDLVHDRDGISQRIDELHQHHYVHGDIRNTNVMVRKDGEKGFMLVDFDWAGRIGEVQYPSNINITEVKRPEGVLDGELITAEHDMKMLGYMFGTLTTIE
jgi:serine/threonine protein kinase